MVFCLNTTVQATTKHSAYYLLFGREPVLPVDLALYDENSSGLPRIEQLDSLNEVRCSVKENILKAQEIMRKYYDHKRRDFEFKVGDIVRVKYPFKQQTGRPQKLRKQWFGPYVIERVHSSGNSYDVKLLPFAGRKGQAPERDSVNITRLKPAFLRDDNDFI